MAPRLPIITARQALRALKKAGFYVHHQVGSHAQLKHPERPSLRVTIPIHPRDLPRPVLRSIIRQAGMSVAEFCELL